MNNCRIVHLTTVHSRFDVRIFEKEVRSLARAGYETYLLVGDGKGDEDLESIRIRDIGASAPGRLRRMLFQPFRMWWRARRLDAVVYHFHDPELIPIGLLLWFQGAKVIYDSHEDVPRDILSKEWIHPKLRGLIARTVEHIENYAAGKFDAVIAATPHIARRFKLVNPKSIDVSNYPMNRELDVPIGPRDDTRTVCYIGGIGIIRGAREMIKALELVDARLILAGPFESSETEAELRSYDGWSKVDYRGVVSRAAVREIMAQSRAGLLFFHPEPNHVDAQPNKMFEYMSGALPVLASDFPLWRSILINEEAGLCADPRDPVAIADAISSLLSDPTAAEKMGVRGRAAVLARYRWDNEEQKLLALYKELTT